jgi:hypothetical protein
MVAEEYGRWGRELDPPTLIRALLGLGITAARDPAAAHWETSQQIAAGLRDVVVDRQRHDASRARNRKAPWPWTDPLLLARWEPEDVEVARKWAAAWETMGGVHARVAMSVGPDADVLWLAAAFGFDPGVDGAFVSHRSGRGGAWRFPLRVAVMPDPHGEDTYRELVEGFAGSSWQATLIDPFRLGPTRVSCDILLVTANPWHVSSRLGALHQEIRAGAVFVAHDMETVDALPRHVVDEIADLTGAWAVGFTVLADRPRWIVQLVEELSHAQPLDLAFRFASGGLPAALVADSEVVTSETLDQRAERLAQTLRSIVIPDLHRGGDVETAALAERVASVAEHGLFVSEAGDASEMRRLEDDAGYVIDRAASARRVQARITEAGAPDAGLAGFRRATDHRIEVRVAPPAAASAWLVSESPFPEESLSSDRPHRLTVVLTEPRLLDRPQVRTITLPVVGPSRSAVFRLATRPDTVSVDARIIVLSGNRILQTARLSSDVAPGAVHAQLADPEVVVAPTTSSVVDRRTFDCAILVNHGADGTPRATILAGHGDAPDAAMVDLDSRTVSDAVAQVSAFLNEIVTSRQDYARLESPESIDLLVSLAVHGRKMRNSLVHDSPGLASVLGRRPCLIQVVAAKPDTYFPFELAYDFPAPDPGGNPRLCPEALDTLRAESPPRSCPGHHSDEVVCPLGFWGLQHVIERHAYQQADDITSAFMLRSVPTRRRDTIPLGPAILGASARVDNVITSGTTLVAKVLQSVGTYTQVSDWSAWARTVASAPAPTLLLLLPHTLYDAKHRTPGLEIGHGSVRYVNFEDCLPPHPAPALVVLLGCETATAGEVSYEQFPAMLRVAGARVVIATLTEVLGRHAAPIAGRLVEEIYRLCAVDGHGMGEVMMLLRRRLIAEGMLPVLALATFGDADWLVGP